MTDAPKLTFQMVEKEALDAAIWVTCSPHEWEWTNEQQIRMAQYCVEASRRLGLWEWLTNMRCTVQENAVVGAPKWCVFDVDGFMVADGDTPLEAIENAKDGEPK